MTTRDVILEKAKRLFAGRGYDAVGVQEIVEEAGVTKPTLYHYFGSKQGLLEVLLEEEFIPFDAMLNESVVYSGDMAKSLEATANAFFEFARLRPTFFRMQMAMSFSPPDSESFRAVVKHRDRHLKKLEDLFLQASKDHGNMKGRQKAFAITFIGMINAYVLLATEGSLQINNNLINKAVHQFMHGVFS